jgi:biopolymer transport protein ExbB
MRLLKPRLLTFLLITLGSHLTALSDLHAAEKNWWNPAWTIRKKIDIDTTGKGVAISEPIGTTAVLVRLHEGVFSFMSSKEDGSDLRFVADDHKTELKHHVEKWDSLLNEAYVWVQVPELKPATATSIWLYYGNTTEAVTVDPAKETYDDNTVLVYHFGDASKAGTDSSPTGANAEGAPPPQRARSSETDCACLVRRPIKVNSPPLPEWAPGAPLTVSVWVKPSALQANAVILSRRDGANAFILGLNGRAFVEVNKQRSAARARPSSPVAGITSPLWQTRARSPFISMANPTVPWPRRCLRSRLRWKLTRTRRPRLGPSLVTRANWTNSRSPRPHALPDSFTLQP